MLRAIALASAIAASLSACAVPDSSSSSPHSIGSQSSAAAVKATPAPAGSSVRDGKFEFRVLGVERSKSVGATTAQGEFVVVTLSIENTGDDARSFYGGNQKLVDTSGRQYAANTVATFDETSGDINPGLSIQTRVAFDVAPGTTVRELICHDSMFSGGAHLAVAE
jgi:Domain of unknown function (DUF4352)